jgi:hypothetical protein
MAKLFWKKMQKKCILVYFVKSGPQNDPDSNKKIIIFIKNRRATFPSSPSQKTLTMKTKHKHL